MGSLFIDTQYVPRLAPRLENFKRKNDYIWNFRCPLCGDSHKNKKKTRGFILRKKDNLYYYCHNCNASMPFWKFMKTVDPALYQEYQLESLNDWKSEQKQTTTTVIEPTTHTDKTTIDLPSIESLENDSLAKTFCITRKIPKKFFSTLYYASDFGQFVEEMQPDSDRVFIGGDKRLVIPFYSENNILLGFQGRALWNSTSKYISIHLNDSPLKLFGLDRLDPTKAIYTVEGSIDSMFLDNGLASNDSALYNVPVKLKTQTTLDVSSSRFVSIYDNEPRNKQITSNMMKTIDMGYDIFIWPDELREYKDINDAIRDGNYNPSELQSIIDNNIFNGLQAKLEYSKWRV